MSNFRLAYSHLREAETDFVHLPSDLGGPRKWGLTVKELAAFRGTECTNYDLMHMDEQEAELYYQETYWKPLRLEEIRSEYVSLIILDQPVCRGIQAVLRAVQRVTGEELATRMTDRQINVINSRQEQQMGLELIKSYQRWLVDQCVSDPKQIVLLNKRLKRTHELLSFILYQ